MKKKQLLATNFSTLPKVGKGILSSIYKKGGTDIDLTILLGNPELCDEVAEVVMNRHIVSVGRIITGKHFEDGFPNTRIFPEMDKFYEHRYDVRTLKVSSLSINEEFDKFFVDYGQGHNPDVIKYLQKQKKQLKKFLGVQDLFAMREKGLRFFQEHFKGHIMIPAWKSVCINYKGVPWFPCLRPDYEGKTKVNMEPVVPYHHPSNRFLNLEFSE